MPVLLQGHKHPNKAVFGEGVGQTFLSVLFALGLPTTGTGPAGMPVLLQARGGCW
jgi:hypothetical protein